MPELDCQYCGAPLDEDEEFEHRTCITCMYGGDIDEERPGETVALEGIFAGVAISSEDIEQN